MLIRDYAKAAKLANPKALTFKCPIECRTCQTNVRYIKHKTCVNCNTQNNTARDREAKIFDTLSNLMFAGVKHD